MKLQANNRTTNDSYDLESEYSELPELPKPRLEDSINGERVIPYFTSYQMREYAAKAVTQYRENRLKEIRDMKFQEGYCLDPNGKITVPENKAVDFNFGYDIGWAEGLLAIKVTIRDFEDKAVMMDRARRDTSKVKEELRLDKSAQVGGVRFHAGTKWSVVIEAAQRHYEYMQTPEKEAERIGQAQSFVESLRRTRKEVTATITLEHLGYTYTEGAELWKPPIGNPPRWVEDDTSLVWEPLTDDDRQAAFESLTDLLEGFLKKWGWLHFAQEIERRCREKNTSNPHVKESEKMKHEEDDHVQKTEKNEHEIAWCQECADSISADDPGICGLCYSIKYDKGVLDEIRKDALRYRWLYDRFTGYDFYWNAVHDENDPGKCVAVFNVGKGFKGGADISASIDAAIAKEAE